MIKRFVQRVQNLRSAHLRSLHDDITVIRRRLHAMTVIQSEFYRKEILSDPQYDDPRHLIRHGAKVYSQSDEDGIIQEIFNRIGATSKTFIEFGVENGLENNTLKLLLEGWRGLWMEGSATHADSIRRRFSDVIAEGRLEIRQAFLDRDNINALIGRSFNGEIDLISIDIDGNDIYILEALEVVNPRVVVIEYNGKFPPPISVAQAYEASHCWRGGDYGGSSLSAIVKVAERKGYALVGCNVVGVNAFFVRQDLLQDLFLAPYTAEAHYQPARYFLWQTLVSGHEPDWGPYVTI